MKVSSLPCPLSNNAPRVRSMSNEAVIAETIAKLLGNSLYLGGQVGHAAVQAPTARDARPTTRPRTADRTLAVELEATMRRVALFPLAALVLTACQDGTEPVPLGAPHAPTLGVVNDQDCVPPPPGLVNWWPGDGSAVDLIEGGSGTLFNGATFSTGLVGGAFSFDGVDDYADASGTQLADLQQLSIDAWVKIFSLPPRVERFVSLVDEKAVIRYDGQRGPGQLHFYLRLDGVLRHLRVNNVLKIGVFQHVAGTFDGSVIRTYMDGVKVGELAVDGRLDSGTGTIALSSSAEPLDGLLDEVEVYSRALLASEIRAIFDAGAAGKCKPVSTIEVQIDIKPGSDPNCFNNDGHGVIPVAILGSADFDVLDVDPATVQLEGLAVQARGKSNKLQAHIEDVNHDGLDDLVVQIEDVDGSFTSGSGTATLTGNLFDGTKIEGSDEICVVP